MLRFDLVVGHLDNGLWARSIKNKKVTKMKLLLLLKD